MNYHELNELIEQYRNDGGDMSDFQSYVNSMAASGTPFLGLNRWRRSDKPVMDDFNQHNQKIDDAVRGLWEKKVDIDTGLQWREAGLLNGFEHFVDNEDGRLMYAKDNAGLVYVAGIFKHSTDLNSDLICKLPAGYRPSRNLFVLAGPAGGMNGSALSTYIVISRNGNIQFPGGSSVPSALYIPGSPIALNAIYKGF